MGLQGALPTQMKELSRQLIVRFGMASYINQKSFICLYAMVYQYVWATTINLKGISWVIKPSFLLFQESHSVQP